MFIRLLLLCLSLLLAAGVSAQNTTKRIKKRAAERTEANANNRIDRKIDQGVDKVFNSIEGLFGKKKKKKNAPAEVPAATPADSTTGSTNAADLEPDNEALLDMLGLGDDDEPYEAFENDKPFSLVLTVTETKKNGKESVHSIRIGASADQIALVTDDGKGNSSHLIFNNEDGKTTTISTDKSGKRSGVRMRMPNFSKLAKVDTEDIMEGISYEATGNRKVIDGYDCAEYIVTDTKHNTTTEGWITTDVGLTHLDVFGGMAKIAGAGQVAKSMPDAPVDGIAILSTTTDRGKVIRMRLTDIRTGSDIDNDLFDTTNVEIQELGF